MIANEPTSHPQVVHVYEDEKKVPPGLGRTITMHVKPFSRKDPNAYLGADELDWPAIMTDAETEGGTEWYIIEYEKEGVPPLESLGAILELFKKLRS